MSLNDYLSKLKEELSYDSSLEANEDGVIMLQFEHELSLGVKEQDPGVFFFATIDQFPQKNREDLLMKLMEANFLGQGTQGGVIGLESSGDLHFSLDITHPLSYEIFYDRLEGFVNYLAYWKEELKSYQQEQEDNLLQ